MATGFTEQEKTIIREQLKTEAKVCASSPGLRKTTVDDLVKSAGISKGAFYKFYETKELLFFEIMEEVHLEIYGAATGVLENRQDLPPGLRMAEAVLKACEVMEESGLVDFFENDLPYLLRKIPSQVLDKYYSSDDAHIREMLHHSGLSIKATDELASAVIRALMLTLSHHRQIGPCYPNALRLLVEGACNRLMEGNHAKEMQYSSGGTSPLGPT